MSADGLMAVRIALLTPRLLCVSEYATYASLSLGEHSEMVSTRCVGGEGALRRARDGRLARRPSPFLFLLPLRPGVKAMVLLLSVITAVTLVDDIPDSYVYSFAS